MSEHEGYDELKEEHGLPKLGKLEEAFGFKLDEESDRPLEDIKKEMVNALGALHKRLDSVLFLSQGSSPSEIYEAHQIEDRKDDIMELYKRSHQLRWKSLRASFDPSEGRLAEFINDAFDAWMDEFRDEAIELTEIMEEGWEEYGERDGGPPVYHG